MRRLVDRWSYSALAFLAAIKLLQLLRRLGLHPRQDGFRRATRAFFQSQEAHPCMAAFGLDLAQPSIIGDHPEGRIACDQTVRHLRGFLASRPDMQNCLRWGRLQAKIVKRTTLDLVRADYAGDGGLIEIRPFLDPDLPIRDFDPDETSAVCDALVHAYNRTRVYPDKRRPLGLRRDLLQRVKTNAGRSRAAKRNALHLADRLLSAVWIDFETLPAGNTHGDRVDPRIRVQPPPLRERMGPGPGGFVVTARIHPYLEAVDLWFQFHHALFDGVPFAEMLTDLEQRWGVVAPLLLPAPEPPTSPRQSMRCSEPRAEESWVVQDWLDFRPLLTQRGHLKARLAERLKDEGVSTVGLMIWNLAHLAAFEDVKFTVVLDVPAAQGRERTLGIAPIRPAAFFDHRDPEAAFLAFNRELARRIQGTRERRSESYELVESIALLPACLYPYALALLGAGIRECVGTLGISVIRETAVVIAAQGDIHVDGFLGIGRFDLPAENGGQVAVVMVKGPPDKIDGYRQAIHAVMDPDRATGGARRRS
ncbi:MAG: hypothetical protein V1912_11625 [bacterium]